MNDPCALAQRDPGRWPAHHRCPIGRLCHLEVIHTGNMLKDAVAGVVPDVDMEGMNRGRGGRSGRVPAKTARQVLTTIIAGLAGVFAAFASMIAARPVLIFT
jgi:hypothetical protein